MSNKIVILTSRGGIYGQGHYMRMLLLNEHLNKSDFCESILLYDDPSSNNKIDYDKIVHIKPNLIIRDMRNSNIDEMLNLQKTSQVLTIDDSGEGRKTASFQIDLLPNITHTSEHYRPDMFLYGYNFYRELQKIKDHDIHKENRIFIYTGFDHSLTQHIVKKILPKDIDALFTVNNEIYLQSKSKLNLNYTEALMSSKILISHFGLMMYEADICNCIKVAINPTEYHSKLCAHAPFKIYNMGESGNINLDETKKIISNLMSLQAPAPIKSNELLSAIETSLSLFSYFIKTIV
jgi:spore coat polysaccharide biosynthesis predicted glycosyltransferase SpsG